MPSETWRSRYTVASCEYGSVMFGSSVTLPANVAAVGAHARSRVVPEQAVAGLDHGLAVVAEIGGQADARPHVVPGIKLLLRKRLRWNADGAVGERQLLLLRHPPVVAIPPQAEVHRDAAFRPGVVDEEILLIELVHDQQLA